MYARRSDWLLFDDGGECWPAGSLELRRNLMCLHYEGDLATDLVRNLGFVAVRTAGAHATVRLHAPVVSDVALASCFYWLADQRPDRVLIDFVGEERPAQVCSSPEAAIAQLIEITQKHHLRRKIAERPCSLDDLPRQSPLGGLLELWYRNEGRFDEGAFVDYASHRLQRRYLIIRRSGGDHLLFYTLGDGLHVPDKNWFKTAIGRRLEEQPDPEYWRWVARIYRSTLLSNVPVLSDIDADIFWPSQGWVRRRYRRLLLPCTASDGTMFLFSANCTESHVALRGKVA